MTVEELIEALQKANSNAEIILEFGDYQGELDVVEDEQDQVVLIRVVDEDDS